MEMYLAASNQLRIASVVFVNIEFVFYPSHVLIHNRITRLLCSETGYPIKQFQESIRGGR